MTDEVTAPRRGGRPSRLAEAQIADRILDAAAELFLAHGYGATSIEAVAKAAGISKRTFYHRFADKAELFGAVIQRLIAGLRPPPAAEARLFTGGGFAELLPQLARLIVHAALNPQALALHRVIVAEATRFPELAAIVHGQDARRDAIRQIGALLAFETQAGRLAVTDPAFTAEQFLQLLVAAPQRRALGLGTPMTSAELDEWAEKSVTLFLNGCRVEKIVEILRTALLVIGILAALTGLVWIGQGTGHFPYPPQSFMIDQTIWAWRGAAVGVVGLIVIFVSRRI